MTFLKTVRIITYLKRAETYLRSLKLAVIRAGKWDMTILTWTLRGLKPLSCVVVYL